MLVFSDVRRLCNDRVGVAGAILREDATMRWWLLEDDEAQTSSSQSLRLTTGTVSGSEGGSIHGRAELI